MLKVHEVIRHLPNASYLPTVLDPVCNDGMLGLWANLSDPGVDGFHDHFAIDVTRASETHDSLIAEALPYRFTFAGAVFLEGGLNFLDAISTREIAPQDCNGSEGYVCVPRLDRPIIVE